MNEPIHRPDAEIIPPGEPLRQPHAAWTVSDGAGLYRVRTVRLGPLSATLLALGIGATAVVGLFVLLGAALISLFAIGLVAIGAVVGAVLRGPRQPLR